VTSIPADAYREDSTALRADVWLMSLGAVAFIGYAGAWIAAVAAPVLGLAVALPAHYPYGFDTIGHLGLIYLATAIFAAGALLSLKGLREETR